MEPAGPLQGVRVVESANWIAAPSAGAVMADLGADVVKVEPPEGDSVRGILRPPKVEGPRAEADYPFTVNNRGKRSVVLDFRRPAGREALLELAASAGVFLTNMLPQRMEKYDIAPERLLAANPRLVITLVSGYGRSGPEAHRPGYDVTAFFGRAGLTEAMTGPGADAPMPPTGPGDHNTGMAAVAGTLAALRLAESTGRGRVVDVNLFASGIWTMATELAPALIDGRQPSRRARNRAVTALNNRYRTADDRWLFLTMPGPRMWPPLCRALGLEELTDDERFADPSARYRNMEELVRRLDEAFASRPLAEWAAVLDEAGLVWGPANRLTDVIDDPQARAMGAFPTLEHPTAGEFRTVASPIRMEDVPIAPQGPAPAVGQHTERVFTELGWDAARLAGARDQGAFG